MMAHDGKPPHAKRIRRHYADKDVCAVLPRGRGVFARRTFSATFRVFAFLVFAVYIPRFNCYTFFFSPKEVSYGWYF